MKTRTKILGVVYIFSIVALLLSCKKEEEILPPTEPIIGSVKVNGKKYNLEEKSVLFSESYNTMQFGVFINVESGSIFSLGGEFNNVPKSAGIYTFKFGSIDFISLVRNTERYEFDNSKSSFMKFSKFDYEGEKEGTFEAYGKTSSGKTVALTEGYFKFGKK